MEMTFYTTIKILSLSIITFIFLCMLVSYLKFTLAVKLNILVNITRSEEDNNRYCNNITEGVKLRKYILIHTQRLCDPFTVYEKTRWGREVKTSYVSVTYRPIKLLPKWFVDKSINEHILKLDPYHLANEGCTNSAVWFRDSIQEIR